MALRYSSKSTRFYDDSTGRFVARSRGMKSSIARSDYAGMRTVQPVITTLSDGAQIVPTEFESLLWDHEEFSLENDLNLDNYFDTFFDDSEVDENQEDDYG